MKMYIQPKTEQSELLPMCHLLSGSGDIHLSTTPADPGMDID